MHHESGTGPEPRIREIYRMPFYRIAFSRFVKRTTEERFACPVDCVVTNGVDTRLYYPEGERLLGQVAILYHPDPRKGADDGLRALQGLRALEPNVAIRICGTVRPDRPLPEGMPFDFHPGDAAVRRLFSASTAFLYPSRYEGFGLPPLEAMACGCPVLCSDAGALPERVGPCAIILPTQDPGLWAAKLVDLAENKDLRAGLIGKGLERAKEFTWERAAREMIEVYEQAVQGG
jgi:glycosyltransferase involved in cell wall biosynthesis